jgi:hypothetical protein
MTRVRTKCEMDGEISGHWFASKPGRLQDSYTISRHGGLQGMDRAVTTCRIPLNCGIPSYPKVPMHSSTMLVYKETTHIPLGL